MVKNFWVLTISHKTPARSEVRRVGMFVAMKTPARSEARRAGMFVAVAMFVAIKHSAGYMICTGCLFFFIGCMSASGKTADNIRSLIPKTVKSKLKNCIGKTVIIISLCG